MKEYISFTNVKGKTYLQLHFGNKQTTLPYVAKAGVFKYTRSAIAKLVLSFVNHREKAYIATGSLTPERITAIKTIRYRMNGVAHWPKGRMGKVLQACSCQLITLMPEPRSAHYNHWHTFVGDIIDFSQNFNHFKARIYG